MFAPAKQLVVLITFWSSLFDAGLLPEPGSPRLGILREKRFRIKMGATIAAASGAYLK